jgi:hypothetical protein
MRRSIFTACAFLAFWWLRGCGFGALPETVSPLLERIPLSAGCGAGGATAYLYGFRACFKFANNARSEMNMDCQFPVRRGRGEGLEHSLNWTSVWSSEIKPSN